MSTESASPGPLLVAVNSARICIERFRVRPQSTDLLSTALRELDDAMDLLNKEEAVPEQWGTKAVRDAVRAVIRSGDGHDLMDQVIEDEDPVWAEDAFLDSIVARLRAAGATP